MKKRRVGVFGGTFDPVHIGHIQMAIALKEQCQLDQILFVPAKQNPLKKRECIASDEQRVTMLQYALRGFPESKIIMDELEREGPSYMVDTLCLLQKKEEWEGSSFFLLLGQDVLSNIDQWKEKEEVISLATPLIALRDKLSHPHVKEEWIQKTPLFDVSATEIRDRLKKGLFCRHLLDGEVYRYIQEQGIYI